MPEQRHGEAEDDEIRNDVDDSSGDDESLKVDAFSRCSGHPQFPQRYTLENVTKELRDTGSAHEETQAH